MAAPHLVSLSQQGPIEYLLLDMPSNKDSYNIIWKMATRIKIAALNLIEEKFITIEK